MTSRYAGFVFALLACVCLIAGMCQECWAAPLPPAAADASMPGHDCCPKPQPAKSACQSNPTDLLAGDPSHHPAQFTPELVKADVVSAASRPAVTAIAFEGIVPLDTSPPVVLLQTSSLRL